MEAQIDDFIKSIRKDGIEAAEKDASLILAKATKDAEKILKDARAEAKNIIQEAKHESSLQVSSGKAALEQAGRDIILLIRDQLMKLFSSILKDDTKSSLTNNETLSRLIIAVVQSDIIGEGSLKEMKVPKKDLDSIVNMVKDKAAEKIKAGLVISPLKGDASGFVVIDHEENGYISISDEVITGLLMGLLNERLAGVLQANRPSEA